MNETSAPVLDYCDGNWSARDISREPTSNRNKSISEDAVILALKQFEHHGLLEPDVAHQSAMAQSGAAALGGVCGIANVEPALAETV